MFSSLRWEFAAEDQAGVQYSKHDKLKELKHFFNIEGSLNILKDFPGKSIYWAIHKATERMCFSNANLLSNRVPKILKESQIFNYLISIEQKCRLFEKKKCKHSFGVLIKQIYVTSRN